MSKPIPDELNRLFDKHVIETEIDGKFMVVVPLYSAVQATAKLISKREIEARINEVENHPKKTDNRWRDERLTQLKEQNNE